MLYVVVDMQTGVNYLAVGGHADAYHAAAGRKR